MKLNKLHLSLLFLLISVISLAQSPFTAGNLAVLRIGDGSAVFNSSSSSPNYFLNAFPVFIDEYTPAGAIVQSISLPTTVNGANAAFVLAPYQYSGMMNLSGDGRFLTMAGFNASLGATVASSSSSQASVINRIVGLIKYDGTINTATALNDCASFNYPSSAITSNGTDIWVASAGGSTDANSGVPTNGLRYTTLGATGASVQVSTSQTALRSLGIVSGQLYLSSSSAAPNANLLTVGSGLPTQTGQGLTGLTGITAGSAINQFVFFDENPSIPGVDVLYFSGSAGLRKYSYDPINFKWVLNGVIGSGSDGYIGLTGTIIGSTVTLFATRAGSNTANNYTGGQLVSITDATGYTLTASTFVSTPTILVDLFASNPTTFPINSYSFKSVALVPQNTTLPVTLTTITATKQVNDIILNWQTATEINTKSFDVERSLNTIDFTNIGSINAKGSSNNYSFIDVSVITKVPANSTVYYRLKMVDNDGKFTYSKIIAVKLNDKNVELISTYPNPFDDAVTVKVNVTTASNVNFSIADVTGRIIKRLQLNLPAGNNTVSIPNLQGLNKGTYILKAMVNGAVSTIKIIK